MMDADAMYYEGYHPVVTSFSSDLRYKAPALPRLAVWPPVKYYFVDFGISTQIPSEAHSIRVCGVDGIDQDVPELSAVTPYDPFKVDIFVLGNVFRKQILAVCVRI